MLETVFSISLEFFPNNRITIEAMFAVTEGILAIVGGNHFPVIGVGTTFKGLIRTILFC